MNGCATNCRAGACAHIASTSIRVEGTCFGLRAAGEAISEIDQGDAKESSHFSRRLRHTNQRERAIKPKPMVEIGNRPVLWYIMKIYVAHGINDFIICCGYKSDIIKEYFANYFLQSADITFDLRENTRHMYTTAVEPWRITLAETGEQTMTGGRIKKVSQYIGAEPFCLTYGDGVGAVDITQLIAFHQSAGATATLTAVQPPGRFGACTLLSARSSNGRGAGAAVARYVRCGNPAAIALLAEWIGSQGLRQIGSGALKHRNLKKVRPGFSQIYYPIVGFVRGLRHPLDRSTIRYASEQSGEIAVLGQQSPVLHTLERGASMERR